MVVINFSDGESSTVDINPKSVIVTAWSKPGKDGGQSEKIKRVIEDSEEVAEFQRVICEMLEVLKDD